MSPTQDNSLKGWDAIMRQVTHGYSWSGQERNVCYLNRGDGTFVNVSYISGFDHLDDSRALGLVDWTAMATSMSGCATVPPLDFAFFKIHKATANHGCESR